MRKCCYQHFLLFPQCFQKASYAVLESRDCVVKSETFNRLENFRLVQMKAFSYDKSNFTKNTKYASHMVENIVRKKGNAAYWHFLLFPQCFPKNHP